MKRIPTVLLIMDGFGLAPASDSNAISLAATPNLDRLFAEKPHSQLRASGEDVGLPAGQIGNSEVGHTNIGAGRVVFQDLPRISNAIRDGSFFENPAYLAAVEHCLKNGSALHLIGLLSNGGVHSHNTHLYGLLELAKRKGLEKVYIHAFMDGRDVSPTSGADFMRELLGKCAELGVGRVATVQGRFYAMDRDKRWERVQRAYDAMVKGEAAREPDAVRAIETSYANGVTDEFIEPVLCDEAGVIRSGDSVICINFRPDRAREITWALTGNLPEEHGLQTVQLDVHYVCTAQYDENLPQLPVAFPPEHIADTLGEYVSAMNLRQLRIAETEKYAHVTFFFNGGVEQVYPGEDRVLVSSPKEFPTYDLIPQMSAEAVTDEAVRRIESGVYDLVIMNLANCDMVGHTGDIPATVKAVETVDACVGRVVSAVNELGGITLITADHGNADRMREPDGKPCTAHTTNPVPFIIAGADVRLQDGRLADIAPTILDLMGLQRPERMTGQSLIV